jgi:ComF family protein
MYCMESVYAGFIKFCRLVFNTLFPASKDEWHVSKADALPSDLVTVNTPSDILVLSLSNYRRPEVSAAIKTLKYHGNRKAAQLCAVLLSDALIEELADVAVWEHVRVCIIPIPLSGERLRERGFNQIERVLDVLAEENSIPDVEVATNVLIRTKHTSPQTKLKKRERLLNVRGAFNVAQPERVKNAYVILVDDVVTTGATLKEAARVLKAAGARDVLPIAIARA